MAGFQQGNHVLIPAISAVWMPYNRSEPSFGEYRYEKVLEAGEIVSLFIADNRPAAVIRNYDRDRQLEYFLDGGIELDDE